MSFTTRDELKTEIAAWAKRTDLAAKLDDFIALAEQPILRELKLRVNETTATGTTTGTTIALPTGMGRIIRLEISHGGTLHALDYVSPGVEATATALPHGYTVQNGAIRLVQAPAGAYAYTLHYIPNLLPLTASNTTNWALTNAPDVYLYGALEQLAHYTFNEEMAIKYRQLGQGAMDTVKRVDEAKRFPLTGGLQIKPRNAR